MGYTRGQNQGITAVAAADSAVKVINCTVGGTNGPAAFTIEATAHGDGLRFPVIPREGRGLSGAPKKRLGDIQGSIHISGNAQGSGYPFPVPGSWKNAAATLTRQLDTSTKITYPVRITEWESDWSTNKENWSVAMSCELTGNPSVSWNGTAVTFTATVANDQELYAGLAKTYDANGLLTGAVQRFDCEGIADTDAAEVTKLVNLIATTSTPIPNLKVVTANWDRSDSAGGQAVIQWGLLDSVDMQQVPRFGLTTDANLIDDHKTQALVYNTGSPPSTPTPPSGLKIRVTNDYILNDQKMLRLFEYARRDTKDDVIIPKFSVVTDQNSLQNSQASALFWTDASTPPGTPSAPSGLKLVKFDDFQINAAVKVRVYTWGKRDTKDEVEMTDTVSSRSAVAPDSDRLISLVSSSASAADIADAAYATFQDESFALQLSARKLNDTQGVVVKDYHNPGIMVVGRSFVDPSPQIAYLDGSDVKVYIAQIVGFDGTRDWAILTPAILTNTVREFILLRWFPRGTTIPEFVGIIGSTNDASFLGLPAGTCYYKGPEYSVKIGSPDSGPFVMGYAFSSKSLGIFDLLGWQPELIVATGLTAGWNNASSVGFTGTIPAQSDFSVFLA